MMCTCCDHKNELGIKTGYTSNQADCDICGAIRKLNEYSVIAVKTSKIDEIIKFVRFGCFNEENDHEKLESENILIGMLEELKKKG